MLFSFAALLVPLYEIEWSRAVAISSASTFVEVVAVGVGFLMGGMLMGIRVIFVGLFTLLETNLIMLEFIVFSNPIVLAFLYGLGALSPAHPRARLPTVSAQ